MWHDHPFSKKKKKQGKKKKKVGVEVKGEIGQNMNGVGGGNIDKIGSLQKIGGGGASNTLPVIWTLSHKDLRSWKLIRNQDIASRVVV